MCHVNILSALVVAFVCADSVQTKATSDTWIVEHYWQCKNSLDDNAVDYIRLS